MKTDVVVVGGGSAGIAAAVSAARAGVLVILVERGGAMGGMACLSQVHSICGLYQLRGGESDPLIASNPGFPTEFARLLVESGGARPVRMGLLDVLLHNPSAFAHLADHLAAPLANLEVLFHSEIFSVSTSSGSGIVALELNCRSSRW